MSSQYQLPIFRRPTQDVLEERLAAAVVEFNESDQEPARRAELHQEITRLRGILQRPGAKGAMR